MVFAEMKTTFVVDDDGMLTFPNEVLEALGWKEGDVLEWIGNQDGSFFLRKPNDLQSNSESSL